MNSYMKFLRYHNADIFTLWFGWMYLADFLRSLHFQVLTRLRRNSNTRSLTLIWSLFKRLWGRGFSLKEKKEVVLVWYDYKTTIGPHGVLILRKRHVNFTSGKKSHGNWDVSACMLLRTKPNSTIRIFHLSFSLLFLAIESLTKTQI